MLSDFGTSTYTPMRVHDSNREQRECRTGRTRTRTHPPHQPHHSRPSRGHGVTLRTPHTDSRPAHTLLQPRIWR